MAKAIILLADGTGNSSSALAKTNVWRLYQALDLTDPPPDGGHPRQVAYYHDGVGTSSFKPLALFGGIFGYGLKRNLLDMYNFLCRNYEPGDTIHAFGFSRGAFTIRILVGLVAKNGVLHGCTEAQLTAYSQDAYRDYRDQNGTAQDGIHGKHAKRKPPFLKPSRALRNFGTGFRRKLQGLPPYSSIPQLTISPDGVVPSPGENSPGISRLSSSIGFVGVWDTVAAYGTPLSELTRGIDRWIYPLSFSDYTLSEKVQAARHALALDDERDTFHPLLWDEFTSRENMACRVKQGAIKQVWFSGMHADVGGGYPDNSLAYVPLDWMMTEAKTVAGLRFRPDAIKDVQLTRDDRGPMHDSRRGLAGYYRYQPRKISAYADPPDPDTRIMTNPDANAKTRLQRVLVHEGVIRRMALGSDNYAPIVLPAVFDVVPVVPANAAPANVPFACDKNWAQRITGWSERQNELWNTVWRRRVCYFSSLIVSLAIADIPLFNYFWPPSACVSSACIISPAIRIVGALLPQIAQGWINAFAERPGLFLGLVFLLAILMIQSASYQRHIHDRALAFWSGFRDPGPDRADPAIARIRKSDLYQNGLRYLKWRALPTAFGISLLILGASALSLLALRLGIQQSENAGGFCSDKAGDHDASFKTSAPCWATKVHVEAGRSYLLRVVVIEPWTDGGPPPPAVVDQTTSIHASPLGFDARNMHWIARVLGTPIRRSLAGAWFQPLVRIAEGGQASIQPVELSEESESHETFFGTFVAAKTGQVSIAVNDSVAPGLTRWLLHPPGLQTFYENNRGSADVRLIEMGAGRQVKPGRSPESGS